MDYVNLAETALNAITNFGKPALLITYDSGSYDIETGVNTKTETSHVVVSCDFAVKGETYEGGGLVQSGDRYAIISFDGAVSVGDKILISSVYWSVFAVNTLEQQGVKIVHKVYIRR